MKMLVLAKVRPEGDVVLAQTCWISYCGDNIKVYGASRHEAISNLSKQVSAFIEESARKYIEAHSMRNGKINCPQAFILLPLDMWYCKKSKTNCSLQGQLDISNPQTFYSLCPLPEKMKNGIWDSIIDGTYKGFHHMPGRYKCVLCQKDKINFNYHYPWELTLLSDHCNIVEIWKDPRRASQLIATGFSLSALYGSLCANCFKNSAKLLPEIKLEEYDTIVYEYHRS